MVILITKKYRLKTAKAKKKKKKIILISIGYAHGGPIIGAIMDYASSGVDIDLEEKSVNALIGSLLPPIRQPGTIGAPLGNVGDFSGLIEFGNDALALCADGVGSKLLLAESYNKWEGVGIDCVAMNANDLLCCGAEPLAFVDYLAVPQTNANLHSLIGRSLSVGVNLARMTLCGGETATLPDIVKSIDLSGSALGVIPKRETIRTELIRDGDVLIGLPASGFHSNGFSLIRAVLQEINLDLNSNPPFEDDWGFRIDSRKDKSLIEIILEPTRIYCSPIVDLFQIMRTESNGFNWKHLHGLVHITGGGLENILRLRKDVEYIIDSPLPVPPEMKWLASIGKIDNKEMYRVFNMGMGMMMVVAEEKAKDILNFLNKHLPGCSIIGLIQSGNGGIYHKNIG